MKAFSVKNNISFHRTIVRINGEVAIVDSRWIVCNTGIISFNYVCDGIGKLSIEALVRITGISLIQELSNLIVFSDGG